MIHLNPFNDGPAEDDDGEKDGTEYEEVVETEDREATYTEHTATARFVDGTEREFVFDAMKKADNGITLTNFTGHTDSYEYEYKRSPYADNYGGVEKEAFVTIPNANLLWFETTDRVKKLLEYTHHVIDKVPVDETEDEPDA